MKGFTILFTLCGGLALFLYGMNQMNATLQKAAGTKMKAILSRLAGRPLSGVFAGALTTAVLQSSSAVTVMTVSLTSAELMTLPQAVSVILGANIGTTMTAQLLAFQISDYIYPILFLGFLLNLAGKREAVKNAGAALFYFGLLFEGIELMGGAVKPLADSAFFRDMMGRVSGSPLLGVLLGAGMTLTVQSSSATIAALQRFAAQTGPDGVSSVIGLAGAIPILLGDNIGTTVTALLASAGRSVNARRAALAHCIFNLSGSALVLCLLPQFTWLVRFLSPKGAEIDVISRQIANAHTAFNAVCTLLWLPLLPLMVGLVERLVRAPLPGGPQSPVS